MTTFARLLTPGSHVRLFTGDRARVEKSARCDTCDGDIIKIAGGVWTHASYALRGERPEPWHVATPKRERVA